MVRSQRVKKAVFLTMARAVTNPIHHIVVKAASTTASTTIGKTLSLFGGSCCDCDKRSSLHPKIKLWSFIRSIESGRMESSKFGVCNRPGRRGSWRGKWKSTSALPCSSLASTPQSATPHEDYSLGTQQTVSTQDEDQYSHHFVPENDDNHYSTEKQQPDIVNDDTSAIELEKLRAIYRAEVEEDLRRAMEAMIKQSQLEIVQWRHCSKNRNAIFPFHGLELWTKIAPEDKLRSRGRWYSRELLSAFTLALAAPQLFHISTKRTSSLFGFLLARCCDKRLTGT